MKTALLFVFVIAIVNKALPQIQEPEFQIYEWDKTVRSIAFDNEKIWGGSYMGVVNMDKSSLSSPTEIRDPFINAHIASSAFDYCFNVETLQLSDGSIYFSDNSNVYSLINGQIITIVSNIQHLYFTLTKNRTIWLYDYSDVVKISSDGTMEKIPIDPQNSYYITSMASVDDTVWLGTYEHGILRYDGNEWEVIDGITRPVTNIEINENGSMYFSCYQIIFTYPNSAYHTDLGTINGDTISILCSDNDFGKPQLIINDIFFNNADIYLATNKGYGRYNNGHVDFFDTGNCTLNTDNIYSGIFDENKLCLATDSGISVVENDTVLNFNLNPVEATGAYESCFTQDQDGDIWLATASSVGGISEFSNGVWRQIIEGSISNPLSFSSIVADTQNVIWATAYSSDGGVLRIENNAVIQYNEYNSIIPDFPQTIVCDKNNNKWVISANKILRFDSVWTEIISPYAWLHDITADSNGTIWIGVAQLGIAAFDGSSWTLYDSSFFGFEFPYAYNFFIDKNNCLWFSFHNGGQYNSIGKICNGVLTLYNENIGLQEPSAGLLGVDNNGNLWYSAESGLAKYDWNTWTYFSGPDKRLSSANIWSLYIDNNNTKWVSADCFTASFNENIQHQEQPATDDRNYHFRIFPNPSSDFMNISSINATLSTCDISIFNTNGSVIFKKSFTGFVTEKIDLRTFMQGIYFIHIENADYSEVHKFVKQQ